MIAEEEPRARVEAMAGLSENAEVVQYDGRVLQAPAAPPHYPRRIWISLTCRCAPCASTSTRASGSGPQLGNTADSGRLTNFVAGSPSPTLDHT